MIFTIITKKITLVLLLLLACSLTSAFAQEVKIQPKMVMGDTANTAYLKGEARRLRENCQSLITKSAELKVAYEAYLVKTKECPGAKEEAKLGFAMTKEANKAGEQGIKMANKAEKSSKMKDTKKYLSQIDMKVKTGHEALKNAEDRKKEVEFEMKGCN